MLCLIVSFLSFILHAKIFGLTKVSQDTSRRSTLIINTAASSSSLICIKNAEFEEIILCLKIVVIDSEGGKGTLSLLLFLLVLPVTVDDDVTEQHPKNWHSHDNHVFLVMVTLLRD